MKLVIVTSIGLALSSALGTLASPADPESPTSYDLYARNENSAQVQYPGTCDPATNQCHYDTQDGLKGICKCHFKVCTDAIENKGCYYDSYSRECICQKINH